MQYLNIHGNHACETRVDAIAWSRRSVDYANRLAASRFITNHKAHAAQFYCRRSRSRDIKRTHAPDYNIAHMLESQPCENDWRGVRWRGEMRRSSVLDLRQARSMATRCVTARRDFLNCVANNGTTNTKTIPQINATSKRLLEVLTRSKTLASSAGPNVGDAVDFFKNRAKRGPRSKRYSFSIFKAMLKSNFKFDLYIAVTNQNLFSHRLEN